MDLSKHVHRVHDGIDTALSLADDATKDVASRVASAVEPALRLALIDAVTEAAEEINEGLSASHVTVAISGGNPNFVVQHRGYTHETAEFERVDEAGSDVDEDAEVDDDGGFGLDDEDADETLVRFSLRLPRWAKDKVDDRAERRGMSTNAYLTELIIAEIAGGGWGQRGGRDRFGPGLGFGAPGQRPSFGGRPGKGWGPGGFLDPETAGHIADVLSEMFGQDPRRDGGRGRGRPGGPPHRGPRDRGSGEAGPRRPHGRERERDERGPREQRRDSGAPYDENQDD